MKADLETLRRKDTICGMWKFGADVEVGALVALAFQWQRDRPLQYLSLHVCGCGEDERGRKNHAIAFVCRYEGEVSKESYNKFFHGIRAKLQKQFGEGPRGLYGWDVSNIYYPVTA